MSRALGDRGERAAEAFLRSLGYRILARNYRSRAGEIDLIAEDGTVLVFVEVRSRADASFGTPEATVARDKRRKLVLTARAYLLEKDLDRETRFDVVAIEAGELRHVPAAFDADGS